MPLVILEVPTHGIRIPDRRSYLLRTRFACVLVAPGIMGRAVPVSRPGLFRRFVRGRAHPLMLLILLIILAVLFLGGGVFTRGHEQYGSYSTGGIGLGGLLIVIILVLFLTGNLHL